MEKGLKAKLAALPDKPGCYLFRDRRGRIIYVGKATSLRRRVQSYFRASTLARAAPKLRSLVNSVADLDVLVERGEAEALLSESRLIKAYRPRFNVLLRDDKRFPAIRADARAPLPRFTTCRIVRNDGAEYFGPFPSAEVVRTAVDFVERRYGIRRCAPLTPDAETYRHCNNDIIRFCSAPCIGRITPEAYHERFAEACAFLHGRRPAELKALGDTMRAASDEQDFERAARLRDTLFALREIVGRRMRPTASPATQRETARRGLSELRDRLRLSTLPRVIEAFDVSNIAGTEAVASMVCALDGVPKPSRYRRYRIRGLTGSDDPRMIAEAVYRRYRRLRDEARALPDLVLVDGGITQLRAARAALKELGLDKLPVVGLAKQFETLVLDDGTPTLQLPDDGPALHIVQRLRDEAHRFALAFHHLLRSQRIRESALDTLPGIGDARKTRLLRHFGSVRRLARASTEEIAAVPGIGLKLAAAIRLAAGGKEEGGGRESG